MPDNDDNVTSKVLTIGYDSGPEKDAAHIEQYNFGVTVELLGPDNRMSGMSECRLIGPRSVVLRLLRETWGHDTDTEEMLQD